MVFNPFTEIAEDDFSDINLVQQAQGGDHTAIERLVLRHQAWIYNIAFRMVHHPQEAEDVTQEVLVKAITKLSTFTGRSKFRTWLYRIAANHILNMRRRGAESESFSFSKYGAAINNTRDLDLPDPKSLPVDVPLLVEEAKIGCTTGMLLCLSRKQRLIFTLGEILGASDTVAGEILEITPDNFRQCLARARRDLYNFMNNQCGLVNKQNPCRCPKKTQGFIEQGFVDPARLWFVSQHVEKVKDVAAKTVRQIDSLVESQYAAIFRDQPFFQSSHQANWLRQILENQEVRAVLHLEPKN